MTPEPKRGAWTGPDIPILIKATFGLAVLVNLYAVVRIVTREDSTIAHVSDGAFSPQAALLSPSQPAFALWSLIYVGVFGHAVRVWLPDVSAYRRRHRVILPAISAALLNTLWIACAQRGYVEASGVVIVLLTIAVWLVLEGARETPTREPSSLVLINGTYAVYLGWLLLATSANIDVVFTRLWGENSGLVPTGVALALLTLSGGAAVVAVRRFRGNPGLPFAFCWGLIWLVRASSQEGPLSPPVAWAATVAAGVVVAVFALSTGLPARRDQAGTARVTP